MESIITDNFQETRGNLLKLIVGLSDEELNKTPSEESWSIGQICHHLALVELATIRAVKWGLKEKRDTNTEPKDISLMYDGTKKLKAPKIVEPGGGPFEVPEMMDMLNNARKNLLELVNELEDRTLLNEKSVNHPVFDKLPLNQWIEVIPMHEDRHIEQIKKIITSFGS